LVGNDPSKWVTNLHTYAKVRYRRVYPGVDLVYYGTDGKLEYDFDVAPHANARQISLTVPGADALQVDAHGALQIQKGAHRVVFERPVAYQMVAGRRVPVPASYRVVGKSVGFQLGDYDPSRTLVIDPVLSYLSYLGGSNVDVIGATP